MTSPQYMHTELWLVSSLHMFNHIATFTLKMIVYWSSLKKNADCQTSGKVAAFHYTESSID